MPTKKTPSTRAKKEETSIDSAAAESPVVTQARKIDPDDYVSVRNNTMGTLIYISSRQMGYNVTWDEFGDEEMIKFGELQAMRNSQKRFFTDNWIFIDDPEILRALGVEKYYENAVNPNNIKQLFDLPVSSMVDKIKKMTDGMKDCVKRKAVEMYYSGELDSVNKMKALEQVFDFRFDLI